MFKTMQEKLNKFKKKLNRTRLFEPKVLIIKVLELNTLYI